MSATTVDILITPTREVYWNVGGIWLMYVFLVPALLIFTYGVFRHYRLCRLGKPEDRFNFTLKRLTGLFVYAIGHSRVLKSRFAGIFHLFFFSGFVTLFLGTLVVLLHEDLGLRIMQGGFYLYFQSLTLDLFGLLAIIGILLAAYRRSAGKNTSSNNSWQDAVIVASLLSILLTGFFIEGLRIVITEDPWVAWSPVGAVIGSVSQKLLTASTLAPLHTALWWFHLILVLALIAWLPYSKLFHMFTAMANIYFRALEPNGAMLKPVDMASASFGANSIGQFTWKDLLDLDACTECGRCQDVCPAYAADKPLSPKTFILALRSDLYRLAPKLQRQHGDTNGSVLIGNAVTEETLWSCTTCMACMQECPVFIQQVPKIVEMRRHLVMEEGSLPAPTEQALRNLESRGHPYAGLSSSRVDWCRGLNVRILSEGERADYLYWVGCSTALNPRNQKAARAFAVLLQQAGVDFAILGEKECCSGDPARRIGNEYLFDMLARRNIETLRLHNVERIVTTCPHCFNTFKNEYPRLGATFEVYHHSQMLATLVSEGRLNCANPIDADVTYHDSCYLGRYNEIYEEPRKLVALASRAPTREMEQHRERSFCCGAGGGLMWAEQSNGKRINNERARQALETGARIVTVACPFCMLMFEDGIKSCDADQQVKVLDIAELLEASKDSRAQVE